MATRKKNSGSQNGTAGPSKDRPVRVVRIRNLRGNIWANRLPSGQVTYNVTIDRLWRNDDQVNEGGEVVRKGEWHQSQSFGVLPKNWSSHNANRTTGRDQGAIACESEPVPTGLPRSSAISGQTSTPG